MAIHHLLIGTKGKLLAIYAEELVMFGKRSRKKMGLTTVLKMLMFCPKETLTHSMLDFCSRCLGVSDFHISLKYCIAKEEIPKI